MDDENAVTTAKTAMQRASDLYESTVHALNYYAKELGHPEWQETAEFSCLTIRFFNTVNMKDPLAAIKKRDDSRRPISENYRFAYFFVLYTLLMV